jgi:hypothetical protein
VDDILEIRIHGVNGTPPAMMLGLPGPEAVQREISYTDTRTSFFAARRQYRESEDHPVEAYSWGSLTAGTSSLIGPLIRIAWLLLLPFALVNVAYWARPRLDQKDTHGGQPRSWWPRWVTAGAVKWAGLLFTMLMAFAACAVAMDLLALGCVGTSGAECASWSTFVLDDISDEGRRVATAALVPLGMLGVLFALSRNTRRHYEAVPDEAARPYENRTPNELVDADLVLRRAKMWVGHDRITSLQLIHLAGGLAIVSIYGAMLFLTSTAAQITAGTALAAVVAAMVALALGVGDGNDFAGPNPRRVGARRATLVTLVLAVAAMAIFLIAGWAGLLGNAEEATLFWTPGGALAGVIYTGLWSVIGFLLFASRSRLVYVLAAVAPWLLAILGLTGVFGSDLVAVAIAAVLLLMLISVAVVWHRRHILPGHAWGGSAPGVVLGAGLVVASLYTVTGVFGVGFLINSVSPLTDPTVVAEVLSADGRLPDSLSVLPIPLLLLWLVVVMLPWVLVGFAVSVWTFVRFRRRASPAINGQATYDETVDAMLGWQPFADDPEALGQLSKRRRSTRLLAAHTHRIERLLGLLAVVTVAGGYSVVLGAASSVDPLQGQGLPENVAGILSFFARAGVITAALMSVVLVLLAARVRGSASVRRSVAVLWDITTFLPRVAHPFAPPCYAERVVPEITRRVREAQSQGQLVILSGHSQGSTLAVAVASRLSDSELSGIRIVTYGSQIRAWFGRIFPGVLGTWTIGNQTLMRAWDYTTASPDAPALAPVWADYPVDEQRSPTSLLARLIDATKAQTTRPWANLYRRTDPIGFRVFADGEAAADVYLSEADTLAQRSDPTAIPTHSDYPQSVTYHSVIGRWLDQSAPGPPTAG